MATYRTTVMLKTDIVESTPRLAGQTQAEMASQRKQHKQFISEISIKNLGSIFQDEGDGYWVEFPSVTTAVLAAIEMHQDLRSTQAGKGEKQRLAIRAVITLGDILHQEQETIGTTMSLAARIEKVTPPDEIYLSHAAWLVLNKAGVQTSFVNEFNFKGFREPERIYKVEQKHRTRVFTDQYIVFTDLSKMLAFIKSKSVEKIESFLLDYNDLLNGICEEYAGIVRNVAGDNYFLTFSEVNQTLMAIDKLSQRWKRIIKHHGVGLKVGIHKGNFNIFRSYIYGEDIETTAILTDFIRIFRSNANGIAVIATGKIRDEVRGTSWEHKFQELDKRKITDEWLQSIVKEHGVYEFIVEDDP